MTRNEKLQEIEADEARSSWLRRRFNLTPEDKNVSSVRDYLSSRGAVPATLVIAALLLGALFLLLYPTVSSILSSVFPR